MRKRPHPGSAVPAAPKAPPLGVGDAMPLPTMSTTRTVAALVAGGGEGAERLAQQLTPPPSAGLFGRPTVLCKFFLRGSGKCAKGSACTFSHDIQGMPTVPVGEKLKTPCRYFELGQCMRGPACKFAHGYEELEAISNQLKASKKGRTGEFGPEPLAPEAAAAADATAALASATGFQSFDDFDPNAAGETDLQAKVEAQTPLPPDMDDAWSSFLSQVAEGDGDKVGAQEKDVPEDAAVVDGQALRAELGWDKPLSLPVPESTSGSGRQDMEIMNGNLAFDGPALHTAPTAFDAPALRTAPAAFDGPALRAPPAAFNGPALCTEPAWDSWDQDIGPKPVGLQPMMNTMAGTAEESSSVFLSFQAERFT